jgi:shikimate kinase
LRANNEQSARVSRAAAEGGGPMTRSVTLVGMMGAGKTTVGRALADRLGWEFVDSDRQVEDRAGRTVADIWRTDGEQGFRHLEREALQDALAATAERPTVIAAAGGTVLDPRNRELLRQHPPVVWLRARPETSAVRVGEGESRPLLADDPLGALQRLGEERRAFYEDVADVVVDVDDIAPADIVERIMAATQTQAEP